ncbi:MAG: D-alanine--D-alanine ligase family protein [Clostridia bacterium]
MKTVLILFGGQSSEHEVSRVSARNVIENIDGEQYRVVKVGITKEGQWLLFNGASELMDNGDWQTHAEKMAADTLVSPVNLPIGLPVSSPREFVMSFAQHLGYESIDVVFPVLHGINSEDGTIQGLLELCGLPYVGPGVLGSAMSMDKEISKLVFAKEGIPQGKYFRVDRDNIAPEEVARKVGDEFGFPCFVKPANAGSSVGVNKANDATELAAALADAARFDKKILVEQFIDGREIECAVLGNDAPVASPLGEITPSNDFYDFHAKYVSNTSKGEIPANIPAETATKIQEYAVRAFSALQCSGLSRVDFFLERTTGEVFINEINTIPGFTSISMYPLLWQEAGLSYKDLITKLLELAIERFAQNHKSLDS